MKYFIFSDAHGCYSVLKNKLKEVGFEENNPNHMLISLGDNFDRGKENYQMFLFLKEMVKKNKIILIRGNHEDILMHMFYSKRASTTDYMNGTYNTIEELAMAYFGEKGYGMFMENFEELYYKLKEEGLFDLIWDMKDYFETSKYVFVHGFIPINTDEEFSYKSNWRTSCEEEFYRARWINGIEMSLKYGIGEPKKKIVMGHIYVKQAYTLKGENSNCLEIYEDEKIIALDAHTAINNVINILVIEDN